MPPLDANNSDAHNNRDYSSVFSFTIGQYQTALF